MDTTTNSAAPSENREQEFLKDIKGSEEKIEAPTESAQGEEAEDQDSPRNRRERRFVRDMEKIRAQAQSDREARIAAEERAKAILELGNKASQSSDPDEVKFYGDTPEGKFAKSFLDKRFKEVEDKAYQRAIEELRQVNAAAAAETEADSDEIDNGFASIEDEYGIDLSGDTPASQKLRNGFIDFVKDLTTDSFPDFVSAFNVYQKLHPKDNATSQRQKALADRSMTQGSTVLPQGKKFKNSDELMDFLQQQNRS